MSNRKKIEKFCKANNLEIIHLEYERSIDYIYDDSYWILEWQLKVKFPNGVELEYLADNVNFDTLDEGIEDMFTLILEDLKEEMTDE